MQATVINTPPDVGYLDVRMNQGRLPTPRMPAYLSKCWRPELVPHTHLRYWCHLRARYCIPTFELIGWLGRLIGSRRAIEIGAGMGDLGAALSIPMSDNASQCNEAKWYYDRLNQPPTVPPDDVERIDALEAIKRHQAEVVVAAWVTQLFKEGDVDGNMYGVDEEAILDAGLQYVHIGNVCVHKNKRILKRPHSEHRLPFLVSRASEPAGNVVWVWPPLKGEL